MTVIHHRIISVNFATDDEKTGLDVKKLVDAALRLNGYNMRMIHVGHSTKEIDK